MDVDECLDAAAAVTDIEANCCKRGPQFTAVAHGGQCGDYRGGSEDAGGQQGLHYYYTNIDYNKNNCNNNVYPYQAW